MLDIACQPNFSVMLSFYSPLDQWDSAEHAESVNGHNHMNVRWDNLSKDLNAKMQLLLNTVQQEQLSSVHLKPSV